MIVPATIGLFITPLYLFVDSYPMLAGAFIAQGAFLGAIHGQNPSYLSERFPTEVRATASGFCYHQGAIWAGPESRHADQPLDLHLLHRGDEESGRCGRFEDDFEPDRNAKRLDDDIDSGQGAPHRGHVKRIAGHFFELGVVYRNSSG
jgi:hypothetical protein